MTALHTALQSLSPTSYNTVPTTPPDSTTYLQTIFHDARTIIDSIPLPDGPSPSSSSTTSTPSAESKTSNTRPRSISQISLSSARPPPTTNTLLQKEWAKPLRLSAKDNPLGMSVYKLAGKDGRGAWFARRSVHEGLGFKAWKGALQREFGEGLKKVAAEGGAGRPGEGNVRGIGGERKVEGWGVEGLGGVEVYHLSAQFPGPTAPRDFVTLLLTNETALEDTTPSEASEGRARKAGKATDGPRHFMVVSRPCEHPECPPREGYVRGQYESVEFIREIPREKARKSMSAVNLSNVVKTKEPSTSKERDVILQSAMKKVNGTNDGDLTDKDGISPTVAEEIVREGRQRGKTISFAGSRGASAKGEKMDAPGTDEDEDELNPVEWIMVTRSDPGGNVPRFMVERGTPGSIVADASKFLDWACKKEYDEEDLSTSNADDTTATKVNKHSDLEAYATNGHLAGLSGPTGDAGDSERVPSKLTTEPVESIPGAPVQVESGGFLTTVANAAYTGLETYAPQAVINRLPGHSPEPSMSASMASVRDSAAVTSPSLTKKSSASTISSVGSFASADSHFERSASLQTSAPGDEPTTTTSSKATLTPHEKELAKLNDRKAALNEKLAKAREKETRDKEELTSKESERLRKAEEKHAQEVARQEEKYKKEIAKLEAKRAKEAKKDEERKRRADDRDEKVKLTREREEARQELEVVKRERDILKEQVRLLQRENTQLVARLGKMEEGPSVLKGLNAAAQADGRGRSGSGSLRKSKEKARDEKGGEAISGLVSTEAKALKENVPVKGI